MTATADPTYSPKIHANGPDELVVESGGQITMLPGSSLVRAGSIQRIANAGFRVGATAGFTLADNKGVANLPASQTGSKLIIPLTDLKVGDTLTGFTVLASVNSGGGTVTIDADLRKVSPAAAAASTDASIGTITQVSVTAATAVAAAKTGLAEVIAAGVGYYVVLTATTGAGCTIEVLGVNYTFDTV